MLEFKRSKRLEDIEQRQAAVKQASSSGGADPKSRKLQQEANELKLKLQKDSRNPGFERAFFSSGGTKRSVQPAASGGFSSQKAGAALGLAQTALGGQNSGQTSVSGGALSGALGGAQAGMALGPVGALVGGGLGAVTGGLAAKKAAKKAKAEIEAQRLEAEGRIEEDKADRLNKALSGLQSQFGASLNF